MKNQDTTLPGFESFGLNPALIRVIDELGFESPTSIQEQTIAPLLAGHDLLGQAQTGTGKTAAFALPLLNHLDAKLPGVQVMVLTPTRELAIQVSAAFEQFAKYMSGIKILPVYGGADMGGQLRALKQGVQIVVGTPGRVMDHMRRKSLNLKNLTCIVLDEADEMLNMGFQEDIDWILENAPEERQMMLFSATIPTAIRQIAKRFMHNPREITIQTKTSTVASLRQRYWLATGVNKLDALSRILEAEEYDGVIAFVRTRAATVRLANDLEGRGFNAAPLSGDISQRQREQTIDRLKAKRIDILVATDVAARGLDVDRISHVINYDVPHDAKAYIHRVGRTGRAGRSGEAILFITPRDRGMLRGIEKMTRQKITEMSLPTTKMINEQRIASFKQKIADKIEQGKLDFFRQIVLELNVDNGLDPLDIAAAAASMSQGEKALLLSERATSARRQSEPRRAVSVRSSRPEPRRAGNKREKFERADKRTPDYKAVKRTPDHNADKRVLNYKMENYRVEVGLVHGIQAGNLMGAIANEAGLDGKDIGKIIIGDDFSTIDLPEGMPTQILKDLKRVRIAGRPLAIALSSSPTRHRGRKQALASRKLRRLARVQRGRV